MVFVENVLYMKSKGKELEIGSKIKKVTFKADLIQGRIRVCLQLKLVLLQIQEIQEKVELRNQKKVRREDSRNLEGLRNLSMTIFLLVIVSEDRLNLLLSLKVETLLLTL